MFLFHNYHFLSVVYLIGDVLNHGIPKSDWFFHWRPPNLHILITTPVIIFEDVAYMLPIPAHPMKVGVFFKI